MIEVRNKEDCCGCGSCVQICPAKCIRMERDEEGFDYPVIDQKSCIQCGACDRACPMNEGGKPGDRVPTVYGGWNRDLGVRMKSSSGGVFSLFAKHILEEEGTVFGAAVCEDLKVRHIRVTDPDQLEPLRKSKYVESSIGNTFCEAREDLRLGKRVLFTGTPCQISGLRRFLGGKTQGLYTCDFVCHGVPSPMFFEKYIGWLEEKYEDQVTGFDFRNKKAAWRSSGQQMGTVIHFASGKEILHIPALKDPYMNGFLSDLCLRRSCTSCRFKVFPKGDADITIADFWGVRKAEPSLYNQTGTSLVIVNTDSGEELFRKVQSGFFGKKVLLEKAIKKNPCLTRSSQGQSLEARKAFYKSLDESFEKTRRRYLTAGYWLTARIQKAVFSRSRIQKESDS